MTRRRRAESKAAGDAQTAASIVASVAFLRALVHPTRAQIVEFLLDGERCVREMTVPLNLSQPLVSRHLALLRGVGLVRMRCEGTLTTTPSTGTLRRRCEGIP